MDFEKALKATGDPVGTSYKRSAAPGSFSPIGVMLHHTAGVGTGIPKLVRDGRPGVPGPLCNLLLTQSCRWEVITDGKANDSGNGSGVVLRQVRNAHSGGKRVKRDAAKRGLNDTTNGNPYFYDIEVEHVGTHGRYTDAQIDCLARGVAAILINYNWPVNVVLHHRQWTRRKIDMSYRGNIWKKIKYWMRPTIQRGSVGKAVRVAKRHLVKHGYSRKGMYKLGVPTKHFDHVMKQRVMKFQRSKQLVQDGIVGPATWFALLRD